MQPLARRTVLVVEDDGDLRHLFATALRASGFHVREVDDGISALRAIEHTLPDAVILDLTLPTLDGVSVREEIAAHANTRHIPVIVVTGSTLDVTELAVAAMLRKPVELPLLIAAVRDALTAFPATPTATPNGPATG